MVVKFDLPNVKQTLQMSNTLAHDPSTQLTKELTKEEFLKFMLDNGFTPNIEKKTPNYDIVGLPWQKPVADCLHEKLQPTRQLDLNQ
jgi:hypothetical protein